MAIDHESLEKLERSILDLGAELFHLKNEVYSLRNAHHTFLDVLHGLKMILDEKGLITTDDFDSAVELGQAISGLNSYEAIIEAEQQRFKKSSH